MNKNKVSRAALGVKKNAPQINNSNIPGFEQFADASMAQVEHRTIFDFLRTIPHAWHGDEMARFGNVVKKWADAVPLAWVPLVHPDLGVVRAYPVPFMQWVYSTVAKQFGWPLNAIALEDGTREQREELRKLDGARKQLEMAGEAVSNPELKEAFAKVTQHLEAEANRLRSIETSSGPVNPTPPPPLRAI